MIKIIPLGQSLLERGWGIYHQYSDKVFNFGNSAIPAWGHLLMKPDELCYYLYKYTDKETVELMVDYVYN